MIGQRVLNLENYKGGESLTLYTTPQVIEKLNRLVENNEKFKGLSPEDAALRIMITRMKHIGYAPERK